MGVYAQLNSIDDRVADTAPTGHPAALDEDPSPISPTTKFRHRSTKSQHSNKLSTEGDGSDDEGDWGFDDEEEGIELMPTSASSRTIASEGEVEGEGRHVDEDEDVHSPAAMVRRVSIHCYTFTLKRWTSHP